MNDNPQNVQLTDVLDEDDISLLTNICNDNNDGPPTTTDVATTPNSEDRRDAPTSVATRVRNPPRSKNWCFTLNNYTEADLTRIASAGSTQVDYLIFGKEVGSSGTPHLQGFVSFPLRKTLTSVIDLLGQCHCSIARSILHSIEYCKKEGDYTEYGVPPSVGGNRKEMDVFKESVKSGMTDLRQIRENFSNVYARYKTFVLDYVQDHLARPSVDIHPLRKWQTDVYEILKRPPDKRTILFLVGLVGNEGKSWFFRYYESLHPDTTQIILPGRKIDMAYILRTDLRVIFFDCPRSKQGEYIQYDFLEEIKNGHVASNKYQPIMKRFEPPHVVVAMNEGPNTTMLSADRVQVMYLDSSNNTGPFEQTDTEQTGTTVVPE